MSTLLELRDSVILGQATKIDLEELHYATGYSEILSIIKDALISNVADYEGQLIKRIGDNEFGTIEVCYDLYMMEYNKIKFEFLIRFYDGVLDKFFINVKSISADLVRFSSNDDDEDNALAASNERIVDIWNKKGLASRFEGFNVRGLKYDKGCIKPGKDRFFCESEAFEQIMTLYRGASFNAWISMKEFVMDPKRFVYVIWGPTKDNNGYLVKIGSTNDTKTRFKNIKNTECKILEYEVVEVAHGKTAESRMRMKLHEYDFASLGGVAYKNEWLRFDKRCNAKKFFEEHWNELLEIGKAAKIGKFVSKPQRVASKTIEIRRGFEVDNELVDIEWIEAE